MLADRGLAVTGVDPSAVSLDVAKAKPGAEKVTWIHGYATDVPPLQVDLVTMTANVAQVFLTDEDFHVTLRAAHAALRPGGRLVFETRDPAAKAWLEWNREHSYAQTDVPGVGSVRSWVELLDVSGELVTFRGICVFDSDSDQIVSDCTLRFRSREEVTAILTAAGFTTDEVREAPDRPAREMVFLCTRDDRRSPAVMS
jgi:SAM-dependent methyltransferase